MAYFVYARKFFMDILLGRHRTFFTQFRLIFAIFIHDGFTPALRSLPAWETFGDFRRLFKDTFLHTRNCSACYLQLLGTA